MTRTRISLVIPIEPVPASRARYSSRNKRAYHSDKYAAYLKDTTQRIKRMTADMPKMSGPVAVLIEFICHRPKKPTNPYPRGDFDNLAKAITDAMTQAGTVWRDDVQVAMAFIMKAYAEPGEAPHTKLTVWELDGGYRRCWPGEAAMEAMSLPE